MRKAALVFLLSSAVALGQKFYPDDPIWKMPEPLPAEAAASRELSDFYDYFLYTFADPSEEHEDTAGVIPAKGVNTLGEVPDSEWFTNRMGRFEMANEELLRGPGDDRPPSKEGVWTIVSAKTEGLTPGFRIKDATGEQYLLKFDPQKNPEMASAADYLGSRFFHALGYNVPQNYIVSFTPDRLAVGAGVKVLNNAGVERDMTLSDIEEILDRVPQSPDGSIRVLASRFLKGKPLGGFRYHGGRSDDPNDIYRHEHRRDLRGLYVFCSWLGHDDSRSINTLDMLVEEDGRKFVRHYLIDFGSVLGSASEEPNSPRGGHQYLYDFDKAVVQVVTLGALVPKWARHDWTLFPSLGRFGWKLYEPDEWVPEYKNPAFDNRLPDDTYWGAKKVMSFSDDNIRAIVSGAQYSNPEAAAWLVTCLTKRRDAIGNVYFRRVLPLDHFEVRDGRLVYEHLGKKYGLFDAPAIDTSWSRFDNRAETHAPLEATGERIPTVAMTAADGAYFAAKLSGDDPEKTVTVFLRKESDSLKVVGIERTWPASLLKQ